MLGFEQLLMSVATEVSSSEAITAMIVAIATAITSVGGMLAIILPRIKTNSVLAEKAKEIAIEGSRAATFAARGVIENREKIKEGIGIGLQLGPEQLRTYAEDHKEEIAREGRELDIKRKQLDRLLEMIPKEGQIDLVENFPR
jgi:hypothetical protein